MAEQVAETSMNVVLFQLASDSHICRVYTRLCCGKQSYTHGMCNYEIQTMLKRKRDCVHLGSPRALHGPHTHTHIHRAHIHACKYPHVHIHACMLTTNDPSRLTNPALSCIQVRTLTKHTNTFFTHLCTVNTTTCTDCAHWELCWSDHSKFIMIQCLLLDRFN